jgi:hypothetical protein
MQKGASNVAPKATMVEWMGEKGQPWRMALGIDRGVPLLQSVSYQKEGAWVELAEGLRPDFEVVTGIRKPDPKHGHHYAQRWNTYSDLPFERPSEVQRHAAFYHSTRLSVRRVGARIECTFDGVSMGPFAGIYRITVFEGANLIKTEVIAATDAPSLCYLYQGGLRGFASGHIEYIGLNRQKQQIDVAFGPCDARRVIRSRGRSACVAMPAGAVGVCPPPHAFFFPRQVESALGFLYYRRHTDGLGIGVRHSEHPDYADRDEIVNKNAWACYNAPPGTRQRMAAYFYLSDGDCDTCRTGYMAYTHGDAYKPLPGYKVVANHFHLSYSTLWKQNPAKEQDWIRLFKQAGVDIAILNDFHDDGHQWDNTDVRLEEMHAYFAACRAFSDEHFLIIPGEEPNCGTGGHWNLFTAHPVYYAKSRAANQPFVEKTRYGEYYRLSNMEEVRQFLDATDGLFLTPHPYTKANEDYPAGYLDSPLFNSRRYLGIGFRYMPADLSLKRLGDGRNFDTLDAINNRADHPKYIMGEVDTYIKRYEDDLYGDFNVNYVRLDALPTVDDRSALVEALRRGDFFVTTGEMLIHRWVVQGHNAQAELEWTFPPEFAEIVYGDGESCGHQLLDLRDRPPFSRETLRFQVPEGMKWVRFTAWDCAVNGAFTQPVFLPGV